MSPMLSVTAPTRGVAWLLGICLQMFSGCTIAYAAVNASPTPNFGTPVSSLINLFLALGVVIALAILTIKFLSKRSNVKQKGMIQIIAARQLAPNRSVQVIEFEGQRWVIGVGDNVTLLSEIHADEDTGEVKELPDKTSFGMLLSDALHSVRSRYIGLRDEDGGAPRDS